MASARTIVHQCDDLRDVLHAIKKRATLAESEARGANSQANKLGVRVSGGNGDDVSYSDPTKNNALNAIATLEQVQSDLSSAKEFLYRTASVLGEWAPNKINDGERRCGADDCAGPHYSRGLCEPHYRKELRAEARRRAIVEQERKAS